MSTRFRKIVSLRATPAALVLGLAFAGTAGAVHTHVKIADSIESARADHAIIGFNVWVPSDYATNTARRYPVIYFLHGIGGNKNNHNNELLNAYSDAAAQNLITAGAIVVFLDSQGIKTVPTHEDDHDTFWADAYDGHRKVESDTLAIINHVDLNYRTLSVPGRSDHRALMGFSMGAFGAASLALKYPDKFSSALLLDGAMQTWEELTRTTGDGKATIARMMFDKDVTKYNPFSPWGNLPLKATEVISKGVTFRTFAGKFGTPDTLDNYAWDFHEALKSYGVATADQFYDTAELHALPKLLSPTNAADRDAALQNWRFIQDAFERSTKTGTPDDGALLRNSPNVAPAAPSMLLGEDNSPVARAYRGILSFHTGALRDLTISDVKLKLTRVAGGTGNIGSLGPLRVDMKVGHFGSSAALETADFADPATYTNVGAFTAFPSGPGQSMEISLSEEVRLYINRHGITQFRLHFDQAGTTAGAETMSFATADNTTAGWRPTLTISYQTP